MVRHFPTIALALLLGAGVVALGPFAGADDGRAVDGQRARQLVSDGALLLDVRTTDEFAAGHLEGAVNIPISELPRRLSELGAPERDIVVYCRSGTRSAQAAALLESNGFARVYDLGAYRRW
jgi:phage shock protein E